MGDKTPIHIKLMIKQLQIIITRGDYMFFNGYKLGDIVEINGKDKGIIIHEYLFGSYFLIELLQNDERTGMTQIFHPNEIKKVNE